MTATLDHLTPIEKTLLITLGARALDGRAKHSLLDDDLAGQVLDRLGPPELVKLSSTVKIAVPIRTMMLDRIVAEFIAAHPDAVVLELGCGLETRMHRLSPPPTVDWYDIDLPEVIALRERVIPELQSSHRIAASLTEPDWLDHIPRDRPAIAVADGVLYFLTEADNKQIFTALTDHFTAGGELAFNIGTRLTARMMGLLGVLRAVGFPKGYRGYGIDDPHDIELLNPRLKFVEEQLGAQAIESIADPRSRAWAAQISWATRLLGKWFARWRAQARRGVWILRYRF
ncbi:MAG TPA: class I SAM-dependent methyltransferase [Mycobacterium sp.]|nr:class I SAM-dependent methyltransferase [Mycobacterium sp.]